MTPMHHPLLDPELPEEDFPLVPLNLALGGRPARWELPRKAVTNLHIMLKLSDKADQLLDDFHEKIPKIDEVLNEWADMKGASPTRAGQEKKRASSSYVYHEENMYNKATEKKLNGEDYIFNMVRSIDKERQADVIFLTDAVEDDIPDDIEPPHDYPPNVRAMDWLDFDGSYVHLADHAGSQVEPDSEHPEALCLPENESMSNDRNLSNLRTDEWGSDQATLTESVYSPIMSSDPETRRQTGPFDAFWRRHAAPHEQVVLRRDEDNENMSQ